MPYHRMLRELLVRGSTDANIAHDQRPLMLLLDDLVDVLGKHIVQDDWGTANEQTNSKKTTKTLRF